MWAKMAAMALIPVFILWSFLQIVSISGSNYSCPSTHSESLTNSYSYSSGFTDKSSSRISDSLKAMFLYPCLKEIYPHRFLPTAVRCGQGVSTIFMKQTTF